MIKNALLLEFALTFGGRTFLCGGWLAADTFTGLIGRIGFLISGILIQKLEYSNFLACDLFLPSCVGFRS